MTSTKTLMPFDYYRFNFCQPEEGARLYKLNLGELFAGDRIESSPYKLRMMEEKYCEQLCFSNLGVVEREGFMPSRVVKAIRMDYRNNWILDELPSSYKSEDDFTVTTRYRQGFPVGFIGEDDHKAYVYNHVNIEIMYHPVEDQENKYRVVRFTVEPFSIKHDFEPNDSANDQLQGPEPWAVIKNPIASCNPTIPISERHHTSYEMVTEVGRLPQRANGRVLFTYDVIWQRNDDLDWASRWDIYLSMEGIIPDEVHWMFIANGTVFVCVLSAIFITTMIRNLRQDQGRYQQLATGEENQDEFEEKAWKVLHADVFRPPCFSPLLLSVFCGTGAQLLCTVSGTTVLSALGFVSQVKRGTVLMTGLLLYALMGGVSGYVTARLYKALNGMALQKATFYTAMAFPGLSFTIFVVLDLVAWFYESSYAVPVGTMLVLLFLWLGISAPLVLLGAHTGYKQDILNFPVPTSSNPRTIPDQPWFIRTPFTMMICGILPFGACFVELHLIMASMWMEFYYSAFGFLLLVLIILIVTSAEIALLINYYQLCHEDNHWWWRSFGTAGSTSIYVFLYSFVYFHELQTNSLLYFGYMGLVSLGIFLMTGFVGVMTSLWFNMTIFGSLKVN